MTLNETLRALIWERGDRRCGICGDTLELIGLHVDHILPLSAGGTDSPENLQASHAVCNISKGGQNRIRAYEKRQQAAARRAAEIAAKKAAKAAKAEAKALAAEKRATQSMDGAELTRRRERLGLSVGQLAREFGVIPSSVYRWESGDIRLHGLTAIGADTVLRRLERQRGARRPEGT